MFKHGLNDVLVSTQDRLIDRHLAAGVDARLPVFENALQNRKVFELGSLQKIVKETLFIEKYIYIVIVVHQ